MLTQHEHVAATYRSHSRSGLRARKSEPVAGEEEFTNRSTEYLNRGAAPAERSSRTAGGMSDDLGRSGDNGDQHGERRERDAKHFILPATEVREDYKHIG